MYTVLTARYVSGKTIEDIAKDMSYSRMQVDRIRNNALSEFEKMYGNEYLDKK
jgi:DNA-directed RNA polymerase specialized sigma subunit